jgi:Ca2+-transporting ATPase
MITGDHPATAQAVAKTLNIANERSSIISGQELQAMTDEQLFQTVDRYAVFARVSALDKLRIVNAWRSKGQVVAMTGDGVNDAPAVKAADIGIVMGITGTDVAKESSDMILLDDNFATIVNAVEEGRGIYENIQKFLHYLLACNTSEIVFMFVSTLIGWPSPLVPIQILWINLITDGIPALSLALEPIEKQLMLRPPRSPISPFLSKARLLMIAWHGCLMAVVALIAFSLYPHETETELIHARTIAFCTMALTQVFFSMGCRSFTKTMPQLGLFSNPSVMLAMIGSIALQFIVISWGVSSSLLDTDPLSTSDWLLVILLALAPVTLVELAKIVIFFHAPILRSDRLSSTHV